MPRRREPLELGEPVVDGGEAGDRGARLALGEAGEEEVPAIGVDVVVAKRRRPQRAIGPPATRVRSDYGENARRTSSRSGGM